MQPGPDGLDRVHAAWAYIKQRQEAIDEARRIADADIRKIIDEHGIRPAARITGLGVTTIKLIKARTEGQK